MYGVRILKNLSIDRVNLRLFASNNRWEAEVFHNLANLMEKYEIIKIRLPPERACFNIDHFPLEYLKGFLYDLKQMGFCIICPLRR